jgi:L-ascorbate metabolism protein UlaG (beta-lactamase superfamily)
MNKNILKYATCACAGLLASGLLYKKVKDRPDLKTYSDIFRNTGDLTTNEDSIKVNFFGTTSMLISDGTTNLMIDGFVTRPSKFNILFTKLKTDRLLVKQTLEKLRVTKMDAILVFHSHYDHVMDSPEFAKQTGAVVLGSESTALVCRGENLPSEQIRIVTTGQPYNFGQFKVTFVKSKHIKLPWLVEKAGLAGTINKEVIQPASFFDYKEGGTYAIIIEHPKGSLMLHSGDFKQDELKGYHVDTVFFSTPYLETMKTDLRKQLFKEVFEQTDSKRIIPVHWDDIMLPINQPLQPLSRLATDFDQAMNILKDYSKERKMSIEMLRGFEEITLFS